MSVAARTPSAAPSKKKRQDLAYVRGVADARFVIRRVFRIVDERGKNHGLDPLEHQALIQIYGARDGDVRVGTVAERLDISPAFASKIVKALVPRTWFRSPAARTTSA